ncbi:IclR family transcriptional regulator [Sandaracinobacteroides saxicola]|uniref:IclR family transcriptional regulator n=1 Tax=Sandaracinobacteroides saxicola TaxID=2759707 RepID=A0A7G5ILH2_9SPHN|nr:IclR family transcriptional regulator [Sandaracinobacteroides saxicola]QMW24214.1 IclR family transcriptional regulator [Sandaracinobacteroides saxicola]
MADDTGKYLAPALDKGLDILELLSLATEPLTMGQIAERLSRTKGEIFRMLVALERRGYILRNGDSDRFEMGSRLFELAMHVTPTRNLVATAMRHVEKVAHETDQSCHLAVLSGNEIVVIARVEAPGEMGFSVRLGYRRRIDHSTSGRVITAFSSPAQRAAIIERLAATYDDFDDGSFQAQLASIVEDRFERANSPVAAGIVDLGAPVIGETGYAVASLTIPYIVRAHAKGTQQEARALLVAQAAALSKELTVGLPQPV